MNARSRRLRVAIGKAWGEDVQYEPHPSLYVTLTVKYAFLALYGVLTAMFGITTVEVTLGRAWSVGIPAIIILASVASMIGVQVSKRYRERLPSRHPLPERVLLVEIIAEYVLILSLFAYSVSIIVRTHTDGDWERLAYAVLPMAVSVVPFYRALHLSEREEVPKPKETT
ncbi:hypothetical protein [Curtobacterium sp. MCSS17_015]|uniref:hypothetical protein n=1 Tax=Curtobacterium sp. MCSS17_015 TaxID=2175666 RepID=UPI000DA6E1DA|nr:hypothetical protein [Curtobacterium sp. MCSS17_015]WIB25441.1 hypothetical protein DEJ18_10265 [Curtobacterium sp. MCSS17_015]